MAENLQPNVSVAAGEQSGGTAKPWMKLWQDKQKAILTVVGGILIICGSILVWFFYRQQSVGQAFQMLAVARTPVQWEEIINRHPNTPAAPSAILALAAWHYHAGSYDTAARFYSQFLARNSTHQLRHAAELGLALCHEAQGSTVQALAELDRFLKQYPEHFLTPQALFAKARCLAQQQKIDKARAIYEDFIAAHSNSVWNSQAEMGLNALKHAGAAVSAPSSNIVNTALPAAGANPIAE